MLKNMKDCSLRPNEENMSREGSAVLYLCNVSKAVEQTKSKHSTTRQASVCDRWQQSFLMFRQKVIQSSSLLPFILGAFTAELVF